MKKILSIIALSILLVSCDYYSEQVTNITEETKITENESKYIIKKITEVSNQHVIIPGSNFEKIYEDESKCYYALSTQKNDITVHYENGTMETIKDALENGHIVLKDLDEHEIRYKTKEKPFEASEIINIVRTNREQHALSPVGKKLYSDKEKTIIMHEIDYFTLDVYYNDGTSESIEDAGKNGKIKADDLDFFEVWYRTE